jgi:hypothetical protein
MTAALSMIRVSPPVYEQAEDNDDSKQWREGSNCNL